jgi:hypothetical protein
MTRLAATLCALLTLAGFAQAGLVTYYEDHFDGSTLGPAWTAWGSGPYTVAGSNLSFVTQQGDFHNAYESTYGTPRHVFLVTPPSSVTQWSAVTRVRFNTPNQAYEQVDLMAFKDHDNLVKVCYQPSDTGHEHIVASESGGVTQQTAFPVGTYADYFWLRLDRNGSTYTAYRSGDATATPDLVNWVLLRSRTNAMADPAVGIAGWNTFPEDSGELAEFDYFRLQVVPEPSMLLSASLMPLILTIRRRRA